jgi:hypothetical protein
LPKVGQRNSSPHPNLHDSKENEGFYAEEVNVPKTMIYEKLLQLKIHRVLLVFLGYDL